MQKQEGLLSAQEDEETLPDIRCLVATAVITLFNVSDTIRDVTQTGGVCWLPLPADGLLSDKASTPPQSGSRPGWCHSR